MAPYRKPHKLYKVCISSVAQILNEICEELARKYRSYDVEECKRDTHIIREFLSSTLTVNTMDDLYHKWETDYDYDSRIRAAAVMHKDMKTLRTLYRINEYNRIESSFWISQISYSKRITILSLSNVCTDEILEEVSKHCFALKFIEIGSAMTEISKDASTGETRYLHLVTDIGLGHLGKCKTLQGVEMLSYLMEIMSVTIQGIRKLLKDLPVVRYMSFDNMGKVISEDMDDIESLKLTYFTDYSPTVHHITALSRLCPNLKHIFLYFPRNEENDDVEASVLDAITRSVLCVSSFRLNSFGNDYTLVNLLRVKGVFLSSLTLKMKSISSTFIKIIGLYCSNIRYLLILYELGSYEADVMNNIIIDSNAIMFSKIKKLTLTGVFWNADAILQIILPHARELNDFYIETNAHVINDTVESTIKNILNKNPLTKLSRLHAGFYLHMPTLLYFIRLPEMTRVYYWNYTGYITESERETMIKEETKNHFLYIDSIVRFD